MGLFNFSKKSKFGSMDELDVPPMPPPLAKGEDELPGLSSSLEEELLPMPKRKGFLKFPSHKKEELKLPELSEEIPMQSKFPPFEEELPNMPAFEEEEMGLPEFPKLGPKLKEEKQESELSLSQAEPEKKGFMKISELRNVLMDIKDTQDTLREIRGSVFLMNEMENEKDKLYENWRKCIGDLNRKVMMVDKIIFRG